MFQPKVYHIQGQDVTLLPVSFGDLIEYQAIDGGNEKIAFMLYRTVANPDGTRMFESPEDAIDGVPAVLAVEIVKTLSDETSEALTPFLEGFSPSPKGVE